jgi:imidazole glycerol-phosphate synthase subunit HisF
MLTKRIIACLDIKDGRTVKGIQFENLRDMGDPVEQAAYYASQGIDELVFLDISATDEKRKTLTSLVRKIAQAINIPFTVGGGISTVSDVKALLENGADKVSVNTAAVKEPRLISELAKQYGSQCVVVAIDGKLIDGEYYVHLNGGRIPSKLKATHWVKQVEELGAGEILFTSIDNDGTRKGFANKMYNHLSSLISVPLVASGGAGTMEHFQQVFTTGKADAALAAGIFHEKIINVPGLKQYLNSKKIPVRL